MKNVEGASFSEIDILPYQTTSLVGEKIIVFAPPPDDETIGCGVQLQHIASMEIG